MRRVPLKSVNNGDILAQSIYDHRGRILLKAGNRLNENRCKKAYDHNVRSVYIADDDDDIGSLKDVVSPLVRIEAVESVRSIYEKFINKTTSNDIMEGRTVRFDENPHIVKMMKAAEKLTDEIFLNPTAMVEMVSIKSFDNYHYEHAVNVAVLSLLLGMDLRLKEDDLSKLVLAALLMDIGNDFISDDILNKPSSLTDDEWDIIKTHPEKSCEYLERKTDISTTIRHIILRHHERYDGSGYPNGVKGDEIHEFARIIAIADTYDALTSDRPWREAYSPDEALELIMGSSGTLFDFAYVNLFAKRVVAYPIGTYVLLSNGDQGEVSDINPDVPLRPIVKILKHATEGKYETVDLCESLSTTVEKVIYQIE